MDSFEKTEVQENVQPVTQKKKSKVFIVILIVAAVILSSAVGAFLLLNRTKKVTEASVIFDVPDEVLYWKDNGTVCVLEVGKTPADIGLVSAQPEAYEVEIVYIKQMDAYMGVSDKLVDDSHVFEMDHEYLIGFNFKAKEGYEFTEDTKFTVPMVDNIHAAEEAQFEISTEAADLRYKPVTVSASVETEAKEYRIGNMRLTAHVTGLDKTVHDCIRFQYLYSVDTPEELDEKITICQ